VNVPAAWRKLGSISHGQLPYDQFSDCGIVYDWVARYATRLARAGQFENQDQSARKTCCRGEGWPRHGS